jgi:hypothetical protein
MARTIDSGEPPGQDMGEDRVAAPVDDGRPPPLQCPEGGRDDLPGMGVSGAAHNCMITTGDPLP